MSYEYYYSKNIEKLYGAKNNYFLNNNDIEESNIVREDFTHLDVYSIDPENCGDVDDAFSYYQINDNKRFVVIHIADPTDCIRVDGNLFEIIMQNAFSKYPSNRKPIHLMPQEILDEYSLHENKNGNIKKAISIFINYDTLETTHKFTIIKVSKNNKFSYNNVYLNNNIKFCLDFSDRILPNLIYNDTQLEIKFDNNQPYFYRNSENELRYKKMIAKFAIFTNHYIAFYLKTKLDYSNIIFRNCPLLTKLENVNDFISFILENHVKANYSNEFSNHDMLELNEYLHMTSPLRRCTDCIIHYLLKDITFPQNKLEDIIKHSNAIYKRMKKIQFTDNKFRLLQTMELQNSFFTIEFYIISFKKPFLNIIINKLNENNIYMSYTLKYENVENINIDLLHKRFQIEIHQINCCNYYDRSKIPELDSFIDILLLG